MNVDGRRRDIGFEEEKRVLKIFIAEFFEKERLHLGKVAEYSEEEPVAGSRCAIFFKKKYQDALDPNHILKCEILDKIESESDENIKNKLNLAFIDDEFDALKDILKKNTDLILRDRRLSDNERVEYNEQEIEDYFKLDERRRSIIKDFDSRGLRGGHKHDKFYIKIDGECNEKFNQHNKLLSSEQGKILEEEYNLKKVIKSTMGLNETGEEINKKIRERILDLDKIREIIETVYPNLFN